MRKLGPLRLSILSIIDIWHLRIYDTRAIEYIFFFLSMSITGKEPKYTGCLFFFQFFTLFLIFLTHRSLVICTWEMSIVCKIKRVQMFSLPPPPCILPILFHSRFVLSTVARWKKKKKLIHYIGRRYMCAHSGCRYLLAHFVEIARYYSVAITKSVKLWYWLCATHTAARISRKRSLRKKKNIIRVAYKIRNQPALRKHTGC